MTPADYELIRDALENNVDRVLKEPSYPQGRDEWRKKVHHALDALAAVEKYAPRECRWLT